MKDTNFSQHKKKKGKRRRNNDTYNQPICIHTKMSYDMIYNMLFTYQKKKKIC